MLQTWVHNHNFPKAVSIFTNMKLSVVSRAFISLNTSHRKLLLLKPSWLYFSCQWKQLLPCGKCLCYCFLLKLQCFTISSYLEGKDPSQQFRGISHLTGSGFIWCSAGQVQQREMSVTYQCCLPLACLKSKPSKYATYS